LVSTSTRTRRAAEGGAGGTAFFMKGRENPSASRQITTQRSRRRRMCSNRLRRVNRGGEGSRNMSELKGVFSRVLRRIRWKSTGSATASAPRKKSGANKDMLVTSLHRYFVHRPNRNRRHGRK